ncbi:MAG TPA: hypothetical protein VJ806_07010 [Luteimonas sp.]|nr:hypothetical protein [Luteimonas sp.]
MKLTVMAATGAILAICAFSIPQAHSACKPPTKATDSYQVPTQDCIGNGSNTAPFWQAVFEYFFD